MCGIFGVIATAEHSSSGQQTVRRLFELSESRGKEASGLAVRTNEQLGVLKAPESAHRLLRAQQYDWLLQQAFPPGAKNPAVVIGHARLVTNGSLEDNFNNQPVITDTVVGVHNGIIVNDAALWRQFPQLKRRYEVDTEVLLALIRQFLKDGGSLQQAVSHAFGLIRGSASVALLFADWPVLILATNTGSLYSAVNADGSVLVFASERYILKQLLQDSAMPDGRIEYKITHIAAGSGLLVNTRTVETSAFTLKSTTSDLSVPPSERVAIRDVSVVERRSPQPIARLSPGAIQALDRQFERVRQAVERLVRCRRCILPSTMPFIEYDQQGVCNYCRHYRPIVTLGAEALENVVAPLRRRDGQPDVLLTFSGGRDSSYALHYFKKILGMTPLAYSYDWGMLTDLGRRNQARMCGALGVEHILVSADIRAKRDNIRRNVLAWLRRPRLGTVPLFMAGDKQFFYYANKLQRQTRTPAIVFAENVLERTNFKSGFCGVSPQWEAKNIHALSLTSKARLAGYYFKEYLLNPAYLNRSLVDTLTAFGSYYFIPHDYLYFFRYIRWNEQEIESSLQQYEWETASDTKTTWRIGDGTVAFYNYIYYTVAGFTENDTFRSNQIREGMISRQEALQKANQDNQPRYESLEWYANTIGLDLEQALVVIHAIPKRYAL